MVVRLFVGNLPYDVTEVELRAHFAAISPLAYLALATGRDFGPDAVPRRRRPLANRAAHVERGPKHPISASPDPYVSAPETRMVTRRRGAATCRHGRA